jgi:purine-nucleoside phosphorylase
MGMNVFGISIITDSGVPGEIREISHEEVQEVAMKAEPKMSLIIKQLVASL